MDVLQMAFGWQTKYQPECGHYLANVANYYLALPIYGICIVALNYLFQLLVKQGSRWMRFKDITSEAKFQLTLLCGLQFLNMTMPLLIVNFDFTS